MAAKPKKVIAPVSLPARNTACKVCHGRIHYYPPTSPSPGGAAWVHLDPADWVDNPHEAIPEETTP